MLLLRTIHGSKLYGLDHVDSDTDMFEVHGYDKFKPYKIMENKLDLTVTSLDRFLKYCEKGVPQYLEAMFSEQAEVDEIAYIRRFYRPNMANVRETYERTIKNFWLEGMETNNFKKKRHAVRLTLNLREMNRTGRFNPTMTPNQIQIANMLASLDKVDLIV